MVQLGRCSADKNKSLSIAWLAIDRLCVYASGSFNNSDIHFFSIDQTFVFAFGAKQRKPDQYRIIPDPVAGLAAADRA